MLFKKIYPTIFIAGDGKNAYHYTNLMEQAGFYPVALRDDCSAPYPSMAELCRTPFDVLLLPGGGDFSDALYKPTGEDMPNLTAEEAALDMMQYALLSTAILLRKPVIGICKGMQLINVFFGGTLISDLPGLMHSCQSVGQQSVDSMHLIRTIPEEEYQLRLCEKKAKSGMVQNRIYRLLSSFSTVNSSHHQGINQPGKELIPLQYAPDGLIETIIHASLPILGMQWHPERLSSMTPDLMHKLVLTLLSIR